MTASKFSSQAAFQICHFKLQMKKNWGLNYKTLWNRDAWKIDYVVS